MIWLQAGSLEGNVVNSIEDHTLFLVRFIDRCGDKAKGFIGDNEDVVVIGASERFEVEANVMLVRHRQRNRFDLVTTSDRRRRHEVKRFLRRAAVMVQKRFK